MLQTKFSNTSTYHFFSAKCEEGRKNVCFGHSTEVLKKKLFAKSCSTDKSHSSCNIHRYCEVFLHSLNWCIHLSERDWERCRAIQMGWQKWRNFLGMKLVSFLNIHKYLNVIIYYSCSHPASLLTHCTPENSIQ